MFAIMKRLFGVMLIASSFGLATAASAQDKKTAAHPRVPGPQFVLPKNTEKCVHDKVMDKAGKCDRDIDFMRRNHMDLLVHQRDETMYNGIRTKTESLQNCINCHVTKDEAGKALNISSSKHFCASCHEYAAVKLDCFECHRSTPDTPKDTASIPKIPAHTSLLAKTGPEAKALGAYLKGVAQ